MIAAGPQTMNRTSMTMPYLHFFVRSLSITMLLAIAVVLGVLVAGCTQSTTYLSPSIAPNVAKSRPDPLQVNDQTESAADRVKEPFAAALMPEQVEGCLIDTEGD